VIEKSPGCSDESGDFSNKASGFFKIRRCKFEEQYVDEFLPFMKKQLSTKRHWVGLLLLLPAVLYVSCSRSPGSHINDKAAGKGYKDTIHSKPASSFSDTIIIDLPSAVFYNPDSLQLEKIKSATDTMIFQSTMHESFYQMRNSRMVLKQYYPHIKITEVKNARYLLFKKATGENDLIDLNTKNDPCGLLIFNGKKAPRLVDMTNVDSELGFYFSK
jgi:hypothetical protein